MLTVETIRKIRLANHQGKSMRRISQEFHVSRNTVRKVLHLGQTEFTYSRRQQAYPKLGVFIGQLEKWLVEEG